MPTQANANTGHLKGIDLSQWQGTTTNWQTVANDGVKFAFIRASTGNNGSEYHGLFTDPNLVYNIQGCKSVGIKIGFYHFMAPANKMFDLKEARDEARYFVDAIKTGMESAGYTGYGDLPPVVDFEYPDPANGVGYAPAMIKYVEEFIRVVEFLTKRMVMVYAGIYFINGHSIPTSTLLNSRPLWQPEYYQYNAYLTTQEELDTPRAVNGWSDWTVWQHSQTTMQAGITENYTDQNWGQPDLLTKWVDVPAPDSALESMNRPSARTVASSRTASSGRTATQARTIEAT